MQRFRAAVRSLMMPAVVGAIIFVAAGTWELPLVWAVLGVVAAFYMALAAFADVAMLSERQAPGSSCGGRCWKIECCNATWTAMRSMRGRFAIA